MDRPNIVFIVADDLGFADLGCYGGRVPVSPVLDRMAEEGIRFRYGYANSPVFSPKSGPTKLSGSEYEPFQPSRCRAWSPGDVTFCR